MEGISGSQPSPVWPIEHGQADRIGWRTAGGVQPYGRPSVLSLCFQNKRVGPHDGLAVRQTDVQIKGVFSPNTCFFYERAQYGPC